MAPYSPPIPNPASPESREHYWWRFVENHLTNLSLAAMIVLLLATLLYPFMVVTVQSGQSAVLWKRFEGGTVLNPDRIMGEGMHLILPWDQIFIYDRRLQTFSDTYNAISRDGISIQVTMNIRYRLNSETIAALHEAIGPDYLRALIVPEVGNRMREVLADFTAEQIYSLDRTHIQQEILSRTQARMAAQAHLGAPDGASYVSLYDTLVLGIELPQAVVDAIERKISEFYVSEAYDYRILRERKESERKTIEAEGIRSFQSIVSEGITDAYLRFRGIEATLQLAQSPNAKVVVIGGGKDGIPIILSGVDSAPPPPQPAPKPQTQTPSMPQIQQSSPPQPAEAKPSAHKQVAAPAPDKKVVATPPDESWPVLLTHPVGSLLRWLNFWWHSDTNTASAGP